VERVKGSGKRGKVKGRKGEVLWVGVGEGLRVEVNGGGKA